ncbi:hypothetical protein KXX40_008904, partial [Aspergillus fumigatus]
MASKWSGVAKKMLIVIKNRSTSAEQIEVDEDEEEAASSSVLLPRGVTVVLGRRMAARDIFIAESIRRSA